MLNKNDILGKVLFLFLAFLAFAPDIYIGVFDWIIFAILFVSVIYIYKKKAPLFWPSLFCLAQYLTYTQTLIRHPAMLRLPALIYLIIILSLPSLKKERSWIKLGNFNKATISLMVISILGGSIALLLWVKNFVPDISGLLSIIVLDVNIP